MTFQREIINVLSDIGSKRVGADSFNIHGARFFVVWNPEHVSAVIETKQTPTEIQAQTLQEIRVSWGPATIPTLDMQIDSAVTIELNRAFEHKIAYLAADIISAAMQADRAHKNPYLAAIGTTRELNKITSVPDAKTDELSLSPEVAKGLFGELSMFLGILRKTRPYEQNTTHPLVWWTGWQKSKTDFNFSDRIYLEVKATTKTHPIVTVNGLEQLAPPNDPNKGLYLAVFMLETATSADKSLWALIETIMATPHFEQCTAPLWEILRNWRITPHSKMQLERHKFLIKDVRAFKINEQFPSLNPSLLEDRIRMAVKRLDYDLDCSYATQIPGLNTPESIAELIWQEVTK